MSLQVCDRSLVVQGKEFPIVLSNLLPGQNPRVVVLLENHRSDKDFQKFETIMQIFQEGDLVVLEQSSNKTREEILEAEQIKDPRRYPLLEKKAIDGWDHPSLDTWIQQNRDISLFKQALNCLKNPVLNPAVYKASLLYVSQILNKPDLYVSQILNKHDRALFSAQIENFTASSKKPDFNSKQFSEIKQTLLNLGTTLQRELENTLVAEKFSSRQDSLVSKVKDLLVNRPHGMIFINMGRNHGHPYTSPYPSEVQKVVNLLEDKTNFIVV